jgi:multiple sugar transport system permease protein
MLDNAIISKASEFVSLNNYITVLSDPLFWASIIHTLYFTIISVCFHLIIGLFFAILLNSKEINHYIRAIFRVFYVMPWVFTVSVVAILWRLLLHPDGIINYILAIFHLSNGKIEWFSDPKFALNAVTFVNIWTGYPFTMVSLLAGLQSISHDQYEAASLDGANNWYKFCYITIPNLSPIIKSVTTLDFIWTIRVFPLVWMTTGGGPIHATEVIGTYTYKLAFNELKFPLASVSAVIILVLSMILAIIYIRVQKAVD